MNLVLLIPALFIIGLGILVLLVLILVRVYRGSDPHSKKILEQMTSLTRLQEEVVGLRESFQTLATDDAFFRGQLTTQLGELAQLNRRLHDQTAEMNQALRGNNRTQGVWGEIVLERVLELSGLRKDRDYKVQLTLSLEDGTKVRPDVVVLLPRDRFVILDAKVSLSAFARYSRSVDEGEPDAQALREHLSSIRNHISQLSKKKYQKVHGTQSLEVVLLFLPTDQALSLALLYDEDILSYALEHQIVPVTPATLLLALQLVHHMWDQQETDERATAILAKSREISKRTHDLWEQFSLLLLKVDGVATHGAKVERMFTSSRTGLLPLVNHLEEPPESTPSH